MISMILELKLLRMKDWTLVNESEKLDLMLMIVRDYNIS